MQQVNVFEAKTGLSRLIASLESGQEEEVVIARNGKPVARLLRWESADPGLRIGAAKGAFTVPGDFDADDAMIAGMFAAEES